MTALLNGSQFATSSTRNLSFGISSLIIGGNLKSQAQTVGDWCFDDVAINDSTGASQNSYPGAGAIIHQRPAGAGDSSQWTPTGGANYTNVDEVTPNDATDIVSDSVLNNSDLYAVGTSGLGSSHSISVVQVGGRFRNGTADATTQFKFQIEKTTAGTKSQSAAIVPNSTTWRTNAITTEKNYPLTLYDDPDGNPWTNTTINSMQIGVVATLIGVNAIQLSTIWALVEYTGPGLSPSASVSPSVSPSISPSVSLSVSPSSSRSASISPSASPSISPSVSPSVSPSSSRSASISSSVSPSSSRSASVSSSRSPSGSPSISASVSPSVSPSSSRSASISPSLSKSISPSVSPSSSLSPSISPSVSPSSSPSPSPAAYHPHPEGEILLSITPQGYAR